MKYVLLSLVLFAAVLGFGCFGKSSPPVGAKATPEARGIADDSTQIEEVSDCSCGAVPNRTPSRFELRMEDDRYFLRIVPAQGQQEIEYLISTKHQGGPKARSEKGELWDINPKDLANHFSSCWQVLAKKVDEKTLKRVYSQQ